MLKKTKYLLLLVLMISFTFFLASCDTGRSESAATQRLNAQIAGIGTITDIDSGSVLTGDQNVMFSDRYLRNDRVRLRAEGAAGQDFLFWADNNIGNIYNPRQDIRMDTNKNIMAVFGGDDVFLAGYIHESSQNKNVIGFWKVIDEYPNIEIYVRDTRYTTERYRYFFDGYNVTDDPNEYIIVDNDQAYESEFIAAIFRIQEPDEDLDSLKLLFVYSDITVFQAIILDGNDPDSDSLFNEAEEIYNEDSDNDREEFINFVKNVIYQNRNKDIIIGSTAWPYSDFGN